MMGFDSSTGQLHIPLKRNEMKQTHLIKRGKKQPNIALKEKKESYIGAMIVNSVMYHPPKTKLSFVRLRQSYIRRPKTFSTLDRKANNDKAQIAYRQTKPKS